MTASAFCSPLTGSRPSCWCVCQEWQRDARQVARGRGFMSAFSAQTRRTSRPLRGLGFLKDQTSGQTSTSHAAPCWCTIASGVAAHLDCSLCR